MAPLRMLLFVGMLSLVAASESYRILCLFPFEGKSHFIMYEALCKGLAKKGHQVDMISHFPTKKSVPNYTDIVDLSGTRTPIVNSLSVDDGKAIDASLVYAIAVHFGNAVCELMGHERMQKFIKNPPPYSYDVIITEFFGASCYLGFGHVFKAPMVTAISSLDMAYVQEMVGSPVNSAFFPGVFSGKAVLESFWDRLTNTVGNFVETRLYSYYTSQQNEIMRRHLGEDVPDISELEKNVSLVLVNAHHSFYGVRPLTPVIVPVGGLHIEADETKLSPNLQKWMDNAKDGVVYFTLGSLFNIETLPRSAILGLYASFKKIAPVKVLMKCADKSKLPPGLPSNIHTLPWIPQIPVLRHKNTRVFITHGGLMGSLEAIHYGIPVIGMPVFADQEKNINVFVHKKMGVLIRIEDISQKTMDAALRAVLNDPKYSASAKRASALSRDRQMSPLDTATYHVEYIIRNGPDALKSPAIYLNWWQHHLIDVFAFLIVCFILGMYVLVLVTKLFLRKICGILGKATHKEKTN